MLSTRTNYHHSKLPKLGSIGTLPALRYTTGRSNKIQYRPVLERFMVIAYPLCDNVRPYSKGIHTIIVRSLADQRQIRVSGHYFEED